MRKRQIPLALFLATACPLTSLANADGLWQGSYSADAQCFCSGEVPSSVASRIVPTPVGGQTVKQVCARLGEGPGLIKQDGQFNHPVYKDLQCGHGPHTPVSKAQSPECAGSLDGVDKDCQPNGPRWALSQAYGRLLQPAAALPDSSEPAQLDKTQLADAESDSKTFQTETEAASQITSTGNPTREDVLATYSGKSVVLGNERYLQARVDVPENGGAPGSRIILDGIVYLKDDESLVLADLYQGDQATEKAAVKAVEKEQQEAKARAQYKAEQDTRNAQLARDAELADQKKLAEEQKLAKNKKIARANKIARDKKVVRDKKVARDKKLAEEKKLAKNKKLTNAKKLAEKQKLVDQKNMAAKKRFVEKQKLAREARSSSQEKLANGDDVTPEKKLSAKKTDDQAPASQQSEEEALAAVSRQVKTPADQSSGIAESAVSSALRLPKGVRASSRNFAYIEAMPANYDIGGNGFMLEGSGQSGSRFQYFGKLGVSDTYRELMIGGGYYLTPDQATRMTVVLLAGIENGSFELRDEDRAPGRTVTSSDNGVYLGALSRVVINSKFEVKAGLGYSSFFEGDVTLFGGGYFHLTPHLDVMSRFEIGDNDLIGLGIRYYY